jgi:hypothetical protein
MIKLLGIFAATPLFLLCLPGAPPGAEDPASLAAIKTAFTACIANLDGSPLYAPLAPHGFLAPAALYTQTQLTDPGFATAAEALLVGTFQQAESPCDSALQLDLQNIDTTLSGLAAQGQQQTDVNELLLIDRKESWGTFSTYRTQIDTNLRQATITALSQMTNAAPPASPEPQ